MLENLAVPRYGLNVCVRAFIDYSQTMCGNNPLDKSRFYNEYECNII